VGLEGYGGTTGRAGEVGRAKKPFLGGNGFRMPPHKGRKKGEGKRKTTYLGPGVQPTEKKQGKL